MNRILAVASGALLIAGCAMTDGSVANANDESRLAAELGNYEQAGSPVDCVASRDLRGNRSVGEAFIIFEGTGDRLWVNRPRAGCPSLDHGRALVTRSTSARLCRGDIARVVDPVSNIEYGGCSLGDFVPYRRRD